MAKNIICREILFFHMTLRKGLLGAITSEIVVEFLKFNQILKAKYATLKYY